MIKNYYQEIILWFNALGAMCAYMADGPIRTEIGNSLGSQANSAVGLVMKIVTVIVCCLYSNEKCREKIKESYMPVVIVSLILNLLFTGYNMIIYDPVIFYIGYLLNAPILGTYISRALTGFRAWLFWNGDERERYDNNKNKTESAMALLGAGISTIIEVPIEIAVVLQGLSIIAIFGWTDYCLLGE